MNLNEQIESLCLGNDWRGALVVVAAEIEALKAAQAAPAAAADTTEPAA